ncbi:MAG: transposase [Mariprofundaceae bacterium]
MNNYKAGPKHPVNDLMPSERQAVLDYVQLEETADYSLHVLACKGAEQGLFYVSASAIRCILSDENILSDRRPLFRRTGAGRKPARPDELTGPNQCWCWDLSYLRTDLIRMFWYLYVMLDEWSRKVVAWRISSSLMLSEAQALIDDAYLAEGLLDVPGDLLPVVVNDRGSQMKARPVQQMMRDLGLTQTFARPRTPNDNPFIESLFSTVKTAPDYPGWFPGRSIGIARDYFEDYFHWYNYEHFHSGIGYIHPIDKHEGRAETILKKRKECMTNQRRLRKLYWSEKNQITVSGL